MNFKPVQTMFSIILKHFFRFFGIYLRISQFYKLFHLFSM